MKKKRFNLFYVVSALLFATFLRVFIIGVYKVPTNSMSPTFLPGDFILASQISYGLHFPWNEDTWFKSKPKRDDIIIFSFKKKPTMTYVKRVTAIEGDSVTGADGKIVIIPANEVFVLNDNPEVSDDSRTQGFVALSDIEGSVKFIWFSSSKESGARWNRILKLPASASISSRPTY